MRILVLLLLLCCNTTLAQDVYNVKALNIGDEMPEGKAVIYGKFIPRPATHGQGNRQYIRILHLDTKKFYDLEVKQPIQSFKGHRFIFGIPPGRYAFYSLHYVEMKFFQAVFWSQLISRNAFYIDSTGRRPFGDSSQKNDNQPLTFTVTAGSLNYVGSWHFERETYYFTNDRETLDEEMKRKYLSINFLQAVTNLPD